ncbi:hypothetical protein ABEB36_011870 [Hypothenemus hampei]
MSNCSKSSQKNDSKQLSNNTSCLLRSLSVPTVKSPYKTSPHRIKQKHTYAVHQWNTIANPLDMPQIRENTKILNNSKYKAFECSSPSNDFAAMSVVNLYKSGENLDNDMDTDRDFIKKNVIGVQPNMENLKPQNLHCCRPRPSIKFRDDLRSVDFVLVWKESDPEFEEKRRIFEKNLQEEGLELEHEPQESNGLNFVKIHAPIEVLRRYTEILKLRLPMKEELCRLPREYKLNIAASSYFTQKIPALRQVSRRTNVLIENFKDQWAKVREWIFVDREKFPNKSQQRFTAIYSRDREYLFDVQSPNFFTPAIHSRIVQFILDRKRFTTNFHNDFAFGIERLIDDDVYIAAYPLHDGDLTTEGSVRNLLFTEWSSIKKWYRYQPLDCVKEYFGVKIALYFAWLGYYTHILMAPALVGLGCFIYSLTTVSENKPTNDICNLQLEHKMCPLCDVWCDYWDLNETCVHSKITYLFDNPTTVFFAVFMSLWATTFLEMWKRYSAEITHKWDLTGFDVQEEHPRPQYLARLAHVKRKSVNVVTNTMEPHVPFWRIKVPMTIFSFSVVLLLVCLAFATVLGVVLYRMSVLVSLKVPLDKIDHSSVMLFTTVTAASINLIAILVFNQIYTWVAEYLTEFELLRTQTEFDDSLTLKIYLLQFVNYYASIFYIAFFKGKFIGSPENYHRIFGYRQEECGPGGCLLELCIQLAVIMIGKQAMNTILEMLFPLFFKWLNTLQVKTGLLKERNSCKECRPQWVKDFKLVEWGPRSLFPEYLEMVLQYGFVTIFVAAFPLAPFFALLNNILEMRLDGTKLLTLYRRPVSQRVRDIGVWYRILDSIGKLSVVTNGFIIAFTSDFIPQLVYRIKGNGTLESYLNNSLSYFNTSDFDSNSMQRSTDNVTICR